LADVINENKGIALSRTENIGKTCTWITENPGTRLTGSFNHIIEETEKWHGEYFKKTEENNAAFFSVLNDIL